MSYVDEISDAIDGAIGFGGGFIVVQTTAQREMTERALARLLPKAHVTDLDKKIQIRVVPGARSPHFRVSMPGE